MTKKEKLRIKIDKIIGPHGNMCAIHGDYPCSCDVGRRTNEIIILLEQEELI